MRGLVVHVAVVAVLAGKEVGARRVLIEVHADGHVDVRLHRPQETDVVVAVAEVHDLVRRERGRLAAARPSNNATTSASEA